MPTNNAKQLFRKLTELASIVDVSQFEAEVEQEGEVAFLADQIGSEPRHINANLQLITDFLIVFKELLNSKGEKFPTSLNEIWNQVFDTESIIRGTLAPFLWQEVYTHFTNKLSTGHTPPPFSVVLQRFLDNIVDTIYNDPDRLASLMKLSMYLLLKSKAAKSPDSQMHTVWKTLAAIEIPRIGEYYTQDPQYKMIYELVNDPAILSFISDKVQYWSQGKYKSLFFADAKGNLSLLNIFNWVPVIGITTSTMLTLIRTRPPCYHYKHLEPLPGIGIPHFYYDLNAVKSRLGFFPNQNNLIAQLIKNNQLDLLYEIFTTSLPVFSDKSLIELLHPSLLAFLSYKLINIAEWLRSEQKDVLYYASILGVNLPELPIKSKALNLNHERVAQTLEQLEHTPTPNKRFNLADKLKQKFLSNIKSPAPLLYQSFASKDYENTLEDISDRSIATLKSPAISQGLRKLAKAIVQNPSVLEGLANKGNFSITELVNHSDNQLPGISAELIRDLEIGVADHQELFQTLLSSSKYTDKKKESIMVSLFAYILNNHRAFEALATVYAPISKFDFTKKMNKSVLFDGFTMDTCTIEQFEDCEFRSCYFSNIVSNEQIKFKGCLFDADSFINLVYDLRNQQQLKKVNFSNVKVEGDLRGFSLVGLKELPIDFSRASMNESNVQGIDLTKLVYKGEWIKLKNVFLAKLTPQKREQLEIEILNKITGTWAISRWFFGEPIFAGVKLSRLPQELGVSKDMLYHFMHKDPKLWEKFYKQKYDSYQLDKLKKYVKNRSYEEVAHNISLDITSKLLGQDVDGRYLIEAKKLKPMLRQWLKGVPIEENGLYNPSSQEYIDLKNGLVSILEPYVKAREGIGELVNYLLSGENKYIEWDSFKVIDARLAQLACRNINLFNKLEKLSPELGKDRIRTLYSFSPEALEALAAGGHLNCKNYITLEQEYNLITKLLEKQFSELLEHIKSQALKKNHNEGTKLEIIKDLEEASLSIIHGDYKKATNTIRKVIQAHFTNAEADNLLSKLGKAEQLFYNCAGLIKKVMQNPKEFSKLNALLEASKELKSSGGVEKAITVIRYLLQYQPGIVNKLLSDDSYGKESLNSIILCWDSQHTRDLVKANPLLLRKVAQDPETFYAVTRHIGLSSNDHSELIQQLCTLDIELVRHDNVRNIAQCWYLRDVLLDRENKDVLRLVATDNQIALRLSALAPRTDLTRLIDIGWWTSNIISSAGTSAKQIIEEAKNHLKGLPKEENQIDLKAALLARLNSNTPYANR